MQGDNYKLTGLVGVDGKLIFDNPDYYRAVIEGKIGIGNRFEIHLGQENEKPIHGQFGYYYKVIIDLHCIPHPAFAGWTKNEVDMFLRKECGTEVIEVRVPLKPSQLYYKLPELSTYSKKKLTEFIRDVEILLRDKFDIHIAYKPGDYEKT